MSDLELDEFTDYVLQMRDLNNRVPKRYIRDRENPLEFYRTVEFRRRYRFSKEIVRDAVFPLIENQLKKPTNRGLPIPPIIQLCLCLRFYATGNFQTVTGDLRGVSQPTVSRIIKNISTIIASNLGRYVRFPETQENTIKNHEEFYRIANFPSVAGCVDGTHIPIVSPGGVTAEVFRNRKGFFSVNVQVVCGPKNQIYDIVVRHPGSVHDSVIFDRSSVRVKFETGQQRGILLGDSAYPCRPYLLTPVLAPNGVQEERYNVAHKKTRNTVERLFGTWKRKFPCLSKQLTCKLSVSLIVICAVAVLFNIGGHEDEDDDDEIFEEVEDVVHNEENIGIGFRRIFIMNNF